MKNAIFSLKLRCFYLHKSYLFITTIVLLGVCISNICYTQTSTNSCREISKTFSGAPETTLCELYENLSTPPIYW